MKICPCEIFLIVLSTKINPRKIFVNGFSFKKNNSAFQHFELRIKDGVGGGGWGWGMGTLIHLVHLQQFLQKIAFPAIIIVEILHIWQPQK